jgi:hypothetical protein
MDESIGERRARRRYGGGQRSGRGRARRPRPLSRSPASRMKSSTSSCQTGSPTATPANDRGGTGKGDRLEDRLRSHRQGFLSWRRPGRPDRSGSTTSRRLGATTIWLGPIFQEQGQCKGRQGPRVRRLSRLLDHRLHATWTRTLGTDAAQLQGPGRRRACARAQGLSGHHRQSHRRRDPVSRLRRRLRRTAAKRRLSVRSARAASAAEAINDRLRWATRPGSRRRRTSRRLTRPDFAYAPYVPSGRRRASRSPGLAERSDLVPQSRQFESVRGRELDLWAISSGLDDLATENPRVVRRDSSTSTASWIDRLRDRRLPDRHRPPCEPRILALPSCRPSLARAKARGHSELPHLRRGRRNRYFGHAGQVHPRWISYPDRARLRLPGRCHRQCSQRGQGRDRRAGSTCSPQDALYEGGEATAALQLPTFLGNHDHGPRSAYFVRLAHPGCEPVGRRAHPATWSSPTPC